MSTSNYAGTNVLSINPAELADNRMKAYLNLGSVYLDYQNNFARWVAPHSYLRSAVNGSEYPGDYKILNRKKWKNSAIYSRVAGPSFMFSFPKYKFAVSAGVNLKVNAIFSQGTDVTGTFLYKSLAYSPLRNQDHENQAFDVNMGVYNELYAAFAFILREDQQKAIKFGLTAKKLSSNLLFNIQADNLTYRVQGSPADNRKSDVFMGLSQGSFVNASGDFDASVAWFGQQFTNFNGVGNGYGLDIGLVYEYRPNSYKYRLKRGDKVISDPRFNKYQWKFGVALQDVGYLAFNDPRVAIAEVNSTNNEFLTGTFFGVNTTDEFVDRLETEYNLDPNSYGNSINVLTPAMLVLHADLKLQNNFYLAGVWRQKLLGNKRIGPSRASSLLIVPRWEKKWLELMLPIALDNDYTNINFGITGRAGPLFLGITDLTLLSPLFDSRGIAVEMGLSIPIHHREPKSPLKCFNEDKPRKPSKRKMLRI